MCREAVEGRRTTLGEMHPDTLISLSSYAVLLKAQGKLGEAEPLCREAAEGFCEELGEEHADTLRYASSPRSYTTQPQRHNVIACVMVLCVFLLGVATYISLSPITLLYHAHTD